MGLLGFEVDVKVCFFFWYSVVRGFVVIMFFEIKYDCSFDFFMGRARGEKW